MRSTVVAGGADPDNARRSGPISPTFARRRHTWRERDGLVRLVWGGTGDITARPSCGRGGGQPCTAAAAHVGLPPGRVRAELAAPQRRVPRRPGPPASGHPGRFTFPRLLASTRLVRSWPSGLARGKVRTVGHVAEIQT